MNLVRAALLAILALVGIDAAQAQNTTAYTVAVCGSPVAQYPLSAGRPITQDRNGNLCIGGSLSTTLAPFTPTGSTGNSPFNVTTASSRNALPGTGSTALITNLTSQTIFVAFGDNTVVATTASTPIRGGQTVPLSVGTGTYIAAITATGASQVQIISGNGAPVTTYGSVTVSDAVGVDVSGTFTTSAQTVVAAMDGYDSANVQLSGTYGAFTVTFQESPDGGTHNNPVQCSVSDGYGTRIVTQYDLAANQIVLFHCNNLNGSDTFTVTSASGPASGTANVDISISGLPSVLGATIATTLSDYGPAAQSITAADVGSTSTAGQDSVNQVTGTATAGSTASWKVTGVAAVNVQLSGTWLGTEAFEKSVDGGTTWVSFGCQVTGAVYRHANVTGIGQFLCDVGGMTNFRVRQTAKTSGTVVVTVTFSSASTIVKVANANTIFDNTSGAQNTIKPASTAPVATDTSQVVALNPNNTSNTLPYYTAPAVSTVTTGITRPADTNAYAANDAFANSTTVPTAGGFTFTSACRASGGYGTITDAVVSASAGTAYQGEIWIFDQAVTATNDNAALSVSDSDILNLVGVIPFTTSDTNAANSISYVTGLNVGYTCVGTANLRYLVKIMAAVTPGNAEVLTVRIKVQN